MGAASRVCTSCDTPVPEDAAFCPNCGEATPTGVIDDEGIDQQRLSAAMIDRYRIQRELGRGGMAVVYLAQDVKHDRQVAVKVMLPKLAATLGARRFLNEIQVAAKLQHPHIVPLHDSGEADGFLYYVMPYVEGESLRARLRRESQLPIGDALQITREVAEALDYAHETGVVHRDIKPENILLSRGHALVADFGIAKAVSSAGGSALTSTGISVGTPAYMSPEQAAGDPNVDHRSDVYSLGCVLYEMLAGEPPFTGPNARAVLAKHALDPVPSLKTLRSTVPDHVDDAVSRALAKVPADRFKTGTEFTQALASQVVVAEPEARAPTAPKAKWKPRRMTLLVVVLISVAGTYVVQRYQDAKMAATAWMRAELDSSLVVIMPFEASGSAAQARSRGQELAGPLTDLLFTSLAGTFMEPNVVDRDLVLQKWLELENKGLTASGEVEDDFLLGMARLRLAASLGAGLLVQPTVVRDPRNEELIHVQLFSQRVPDGDLYVAGWRRIEQSPVDSIIPASVSRELALMVALAVGPRSGSLRRDRTEALLYARPEAAEYYLRGVKQLADSQYAEAKFSFAFAQKRDSTLALAGMGMITAGCALSPTTNDAWLLGAQAAWNHQDNLPERDRELLLSLVGNYPDEPLRASNICP